MESNILIEELRKQNRLENFEITLHAAKRLEERNISIIDIMHCINTGQIIEQYPNDYPYPSCLIFGTAVNTQVLHAVIGTDEKTLWIITAYYPDPDLWETDFKTRKEKAL